MKCLQYLSLLLVMAVAMAACSHDSFKIDGNITNLDGAVVRVVFLSDSGMNDEWVAADKKGKIEFQGHAAHPTLVSLLNQGGETLAMLVVANGDHLKVQGDAHKASDIKIKGNRLNEDWQLFRKEHKAFYTDPNPSRRDAAIEKYVREHPDDMLSTVLLLADYSDYSDRDKVNAMLNGIEATARPASLMGAFEDIRRKPRLTGRLPRLMTLKLMTQGGAFEELKLTDKTSLIHLWVNPQDKRQAVINKLQGVGEDVCVIDILAESDTLYWRKTTADDPAGWKHYWAPAGPLEQDIQLLGFTSVPWYAVTDSTGLVTYSGPSLDAALGKVNVKK